MCRINYDGSKTYSRSCAEVKTMITLGVRELDGSPDGHRRFCGNKSEKSRSLPKKLVRTHQVVRTLAWRVLIERDIHVKLLGL